MGPTTPCHVLAHKASVTNNNAYKAFIKTCRRYKARGGKLR